MSRLRYFPNRASDLQPLTPLEIPNNLKSSLLDVLTKITNKLKPVEKNGEDGLYLGTAGIAYMFYHLSKIPAFKEYHNKYLENALNYLQPALLVCKRFSIHKNDVPSFLLGNAGVYAVATAIYNAIGDGAQCNKYIELYKDAGKLCTKMHFLNCGSDELFVGRAGYLCGALWMESELKSRIFKVEDLYELCRLTVESGRKYAQQYRSPSPLMYAYYNVEYLGAGHGLCSILQYIMSVPGYLSSNPKDATDIKASVDYLLSLQDDEGNFPTAMDELGQERNDLIHWCHGAGGVVYLFAKAYLIWNEDKYLQAVKKAGDLIWEKGLLKKGPGLCHGVAGNGYVFLLLYRLTGDNKYLHRAHVFFEFLYTDEFQTNARTPDNPYSLYEGLAGTACFLADLFTPQTASFPFSDVF
ncbi:Lanthionine synthetase C-like protein [Popillia japonica]|uniref:LanC-like protein 3 homolog n=1 Tax=Popillia japonica TaxID=7064 RepID=A0AAW1MF22_POPJA